MDFVVWVFTENVARVTTEPGYLVCCLKFVLTDTLIASWPSRGVTCINWKFGYHVVPLALVANLASV